MAEPTAIALSVLGEFRKLPAKRKPAVRDNGLREWVPLSGIVVEGPDFLRCVALATGMKCLPASKLAQANGVALHDWHAEVLALRAFNRFVLDECRRLAQDSTTQSDYLRRRTQEELSSVPDDSISAPWHAQPFAWREDLTLHMYCSEAPCGDASMELIMSSQQDATPWTIPPSLSPSPSPSPNPTPTPNQPTTPSIPTNNNNNNNTVLLGRGYFSHLGIVRRKPSRPDAPPTNSKSCSDKLALKQHTSLLSSLTSLFVSPARVYLTSIVLPESQYSDVACTRCFGTRMRPVENSNRGVGGGYGFVGVEVKVVDGEKGGFEFSRRGILLREREREKEGGNENGEGGIKMAASNLAIAWTRDGVEEGLIGGVLQGRKGVDVRGASLVSRRRMWAAAVEVAAALGRDEIVRELARGAYDEVKEGELLKGRRRVKEEVRGGALKGWLRNTGDGGFSL